ncbi:MAG: RNA ligase RtcB family protein [Clostridiales bacterium]|jgi:release factor H-coupled RctB family protein|nr:RNA ligase RtcB family protein [Clostridiales bacterium]
MYTLITGDKNWIESEAISQLKNVAEYGHVVQAVGLPDLHPGKTPVGVSVVCDNYIYPHLIGNDIGCGMSLFDSNIKLKKFNMDKWVTRLNYIKELACIETGGSFDSPIRDLGTIGGGNHFVEFQKIEEVFLEDEFEALKADKKDVFVLIHSGSRGYGQKIYSEFNKTEGYEAFSLEAVEYLLCQKDAIFWAKKNREIVAGKLIDWLGYTQQLNCVLDCSHNYIENKGPLFIHRKGAVANTGGPVIIPGSRGTLTYIVKPIGEPQFSGYSLSHGAGRKWARSVCIGKVADKYTRDTVRHTGLKSQVVCHNTNLLYKEAPEVYKNINTIIEILIEYGLIEIIATMRPLITYKG